MVGVSTSQPTTIYSQASIKRNATYTTEIRDALRWLIEEGFLERQQGLRDLRRKAVMSASGYPSPTSYHQSG